MEQRTNGSVHTPNGVLHSPASDGVDPKTPISPAPANGEFPFAAPPGTTGQSPTNELVPNHVRGEDVDVPTDLAPSSIHALSRKPTLEAGAVTPQGRRSVQFARPSTLADITNPGAHSREESWAAENNDGSGKEKEKLGIHLLSRLKSLTSPMALQGHGRNTSSWSLGGAGDGTFEQRNPNAMSPGSEIGEPSPYEGDADAEESGAEAAGPSRPKKRRKFRGYRSDDVGTTTLSAPTTPKQSKLAHFRRDSADKTPPTSAPHSRPTFGPRRNTMSNIPENQRLAFSEDEGRDHLAGEGLWRRGSAWVNNHRGQSYTAGRLQSRNDGPAESGDPKRPSGLRRLTTFGHHDADGQPSPWRRRTGERTSSVSAAKWRQLKAGLKMLGQRRKEEHRIEHAKSAELMAELLAGAPAALFLASMFQRDEHGNKRIPVLLEQLKIKITDSDSKGGDRHQIFRMELEYASNLARMKWVISRSLGDFVKLYAKYRVEDKLRTTKDKYIHTNRKSEKSTLPKFPVSVFPVLRTMKREGVFGDVEWEDEEIDNTAGEQSVHEGEASGPDRPGNAKRRRSSFNLIRKMTTAAGTGLTDQQGRTGSVSGPGGQRLETFAERQRRKLEEHIQKMVTYVMFRANSNRLCKFLELSALGVRLAPEGGYHGKEGYMMIRSSQGIDYRKQMNIHLFKDRHAPKWFLVRASYVVCVDSPEAMNVYEVILVDMDFNVDKKKTTRKRDEKPKQLAVRAKDSARINAHHVRVSNSERLFKLLAKTKEQQQQFIDSMNFMKANTLWSQKQRYDSFAPVRENVWAQALVDGRDYMWNVSRAISMARDVIYIHDWWLSPELYMRRPAAISQRWRLDRLLRRKATEGVKIYVIMYRNINSAIPIDSEYSKFSLLDLGDNVFVQRSPNQLRQNLFFWAHHEKICVIDHVVAFCGGVDLCFGRWDTPQHSVTDDKDTGFEVSEKAMNAENCQLWPGKDYSNPRVQDFYALDKPYEEMYDRSKVPRMPWHDIGMQIIGQPARDLSRHFVQRWNHILRQRTPTRPTPFLLPPSDFLPADIEALGLNGTCEIQILRSACAWSLGTPNRKECSIMNAYVTMIKDSDHFIYIENQFFISSCEIDTVRIENTIGDALVERIVRASEKKEEWKAVIVIPLMPGFQNTVEQQDGSSVRLIMQFQFRSICRGETSIFGRLRSKGIVPTDYIQFYALRSWGKIGPQKSLVTEQLYIHAKCMIADDRVAIIGSANINERSMLGSRDSEVAAIVRDRDMIPSYMAGKEYEVGRFSYNLRVRLMREHLGIDVDQCGVEEIEDEEWSREMDGFHGNHADGHDNSSFVSHEQDSEVEQKIIDNQHSLQEELIAKQEHLHSFNYDVDWTQKENPHIYTNRKKTTDHRVQGNRAHADDVAGEGADHMVDIENLGLGNGRDTVFDEEAGREVLVSGFAPEGRATLAHPSTRKRAHTASPPVEKAVLPPFPLERLSTVELDLPKLATLPALPQTDDVDIGGPSLLQDDDANEQNYESKESGYGYHHHRSSGRKKPLLSTLKHHMPIVTKNCMRDPVLDSYFWDIWHAVAKNNTKIYREVFHCMPDSEVRDWNDYHEFERMSLRADPSPDDDELCNLIQGHLVLWPYDWLAKEEAGGGWLFSVDRIPPWEIYT